MTLGRILAVILALLVALPGAAVTPDEVLDDPLLEQRARAISGELRCMVCQSESIDESNADLAKDMRLLVRERLVAGDSDEEVKAFIVDRYGEYALLRPTLQGTNIILWIAGPAMLLVALVIGGGYILRQRRVQTSTEADLSPEEEERLEALLKD
jgi:cytochrome c-type biogenesis protein CcmH